MKSFLASVRAGGGLDRVDQAVQLLEDEWRRHGKVPLERLWTEQKRVLAVDGDDSVVLLTELIKADLRCRFDRGQTPTAAGYLEQFPELRSADTRVLSLIYEEFCLREDRGDGLDVESFCDHYPQWKDSLVAQLKCHRLFSQAAGPRTPPPAFPEPGEQFEEFNLLSLLGTGGTSRVFLARDLSLGGKQVVLKVSLDRGQEPHAQGALDHPHIVPVNSVVFGDRQLRGLSMPFRPGLPLDEIIKRVNPAGQSRRAIALWKALVAGIAERSKASANTDSVTMPKGEESRPEPHGDGWEGFPVHGTYAQGVAWIGMVLARALNYAHERQTFHRDVKPGNVLLTLHHGPQLLDFNLAESPHSTRRAEAAMHGGTPPYMAPEQIEAFFDPRLWKTVGVKADIYSLGLVLRELLSGQPPDLPPQRLSPDRAMRALLDRRPLLDLSVRRFNPAIPHALEAIVAKCLAISPDERYPDAEALAEDLQRFLQLRPLVHAANPSRPERMRNWTIRKRWTLGLVAAIIVPWLIASGVLLTVEAIKRFEPPPAPIESRPDFLAQVKKIEEGRYGDAVSSLLGFESEYPRSPLPKIYISFALSDLKPTEAERLFRTAIEGPDARRTLIAWGQTHPKFALGLDRFAAHRFELATKELEQTPGLSREQRDSMRRPSYALAMQALRIALELDPKSPTVLRRLAVAEEFFGDHAKAYENLSEAIDLIASRRDADLDPRENNPTMLFGCRLNRCRVAACLADRSKVELSLPSAKKALERLKQAENDLTLCMSFLTAYNGNKRQQYFVEGIKVLVITTLGETEIDLGYLLDARRHLMAARQTILPTYAELAEDSDKDEVFQEVKRWRKRLTDDFDRLRSKVTERAGAAAGAPS